MSDDYMNRRQARGFIQSAGYDIEAALARLDEALPLLRNAGEIELWYEVHGAQSGMMKVRERFETIVGSLPS